MWRLLTEPNIDNKPRLLNAIAIVSGRRVSAQCSSGELFVSILPSSVWIDLHWLDHNSFHEVMQMFTMTSEPLFGSINADFQSLNSSLSNEVRSLSASTPGHAAEQIITWSYSSIPPGSRSYGNCWACDGQSPSPRCGFNANDTESNSKAWFAIKTPLRLLAYC